MIVQVRGTANPFWGSLQIEKLFKVHTESARNLSIAIGRGTTEGRSYAVEAGNLLKFLEEFRVLLCPAAKLKEQRSQAIRSAQALFQRKLEKGRRRLEQEVANCTTHDVLDADSGSEIQNQLSNNLLQAQVSDNEPWRDEFPELSDSHTQQEVPTTKTIHPRARKKTQPLERFQTLMDFTESGDQMATETSEELPEQQ